MGNGPKARLPDRLCSFSDMGRMPHSERASPSSGTAAPRILPIPRQEKTCGKRAKPADAAAGRPALHPLSQTAPRHLRYASTTINSFVSSAVCTSSSIFSSRFFSCLRITFRFGLVTGCFATKMVQQSS